MAVRRQVLVVFGVVALLAAGASPAAAESTHRVSKAEVRQAVKHNAVVFAKSYAQAISQGFSPDKALDRATTAFFTKASIPSYTVSGVHRGYQSALSDIPGNTTRIYVSLAPGYSQGGKQDAGFSYCLSVNLSALKSGYTASAVSKPRLNYATTISSGCQPVNSSR